MNDDVFCGVCGGKGDHPIYYNAISGLHSCDPADALTHEEAERVKRDGPVERTYTYIDSFQFDWLIEKYLDVPVQSHRNNYGPGYSVQQELEANNGQTEFMSYDQWSADNPDDASKTQLYMNQLIDKGILPRDKTILLYIWW